MSILARFSPPSMTADQYDAILARLYKEGILLCLRVNRYDGRSNVRSIVDGL